MPYDPEKTDADLIIIGAGPAGLTAAQYGARANLRVLVLEQMAPGGQALLIDKLENYPGIAPGKTGFEFSEDLHRQAEGFGAQFLTEQVLSLCREGDLYTAGIGKGKRSAPAVILATGAKHRTLDIPGEDTFYGRGVSYCATCDGPFFKNKKIFVVGGGDAACDEAQYLSRLSSQVILIHRRERFRAQQALAQRVLRNPNIEVRFNTVMREIKGERKVGSVILEKTSSGCKGTGEIYEEAADAVFIFAGITPQTSLVPDAEKDEAGYIVTDQHMASSLPGLFAAGDVRAAPFRQVVVAAGEGAIAAHSAAAYIDSLKGESY
ncbi:MAG: FAD-dependent oxidoreductase [Treponema sp.]|jgi:thioredoxin reductase (NADPH)|nr:FAD-dependent oxidoreductase [Treponema sp.]